MNAQALSDAFQPIYGHPCWNVKHGYGSFLTLEFGNPHLEIREPIKLKSSASQKVRKHLAQRDVALRGDWHLWIYCCAWSVSNSGRPIGNCSTDKSISQAVEELDGQILTSFEFDWRECVSRFHFDLGGVLQTRPYDNDSEMWILYQPQRTCVSLRSDRHFSQHSYESKPHEWIWHETLPPSSSNQ